MDVAVGGSVDGGYGAGHAAAERGDEVNQARMKPELLGQQLDVARLEIAKPATIAVEGEGEIGVFVEDAANLVIAGC